MFQSRFNLLAITLLIAMGVAAPNAYTGTLADEAAGANEIDFESNILPVLEAHCLRCHDADNAEGELRLDSAAGIEAGGHTGTKIIGATAEASELYRRIISDDPSYRMPKESEALSASETETIRQWIFAGAVWPESVVRAAAKDFELPDAGIEAVPANEAANKFEFQKWIVKSRFDFLLWWLIPGLVLLGLLVLVWLDQRRSKNPLRSSWLGVRFLMLTLFGWLLLGGGLYQLGVNRELMQENTDLHQRLSQQLAIRAGLEGRFQVELNPKQFDVPLHPMHPKRLGGVYYRGNDERSPELFNGGFYRTATMETWLVDEAGKRLKWGDDIGIRSLAISYSIERSPGTTAELFTPEIMDGVFLKHHRLMSVNPNLVESSPEEYRVKLLDPELGSESSESSSQPAKDSKSIFAEPMPKWETQIPLPSLASWENGIAEGIVYLHQGNRMDGETKGRVHFGIKYRLNIVAGRISPESELWMGSMYNLAGRVIVPAAGTVLVDRWFDFRPIPEIEGSNTSDPKLLGIPEHRSTKRFR